MSTTDHRTPIPPIAGLFGVAAAGYMLPGLAAAVPALRAPLGIEDAAAGGRGYALTFDDGPHAQGTPAVLDVLAAAGVHATFFLVGEQVRRNPALAAEIVARVTDGAGQGAVLLLHDADDYSASGSWRKTADALPCVLETLHARGLEPVAA